MYKNANETCREYEASNGILDLHIGINVIVTKAIL